MSLYCTTSSFHYLAIEFRMESKFRNKISKIDKFYVISTEVNCSQRRNYNSSEATNLQKMKTYNKMLNYKKGIMNLKKKFFQRQFFRRKLKVPEVSLLFIVRQITRCM